MKMIHVDTPENLQSFNVDDISIILKDSRKRRYMGKEIKCRIVTKHVAIDYDVCDSYESVIMQVSELNKS